MGLIQECGKWIAEGGDRMSIVPWKPIDELTTMRLDLDSLWDRFFPENFFHERHLTHGWMPTIDLTETKDKLVVKQNFPDWKQRMLNLLLRMTFSPSRVRRRKRRKKKMSITSLWNGTQAPLNAESNCRPLSRPARLMRHSKRAS